MSFSFSLPAISFIIINSLAIVSTEENIFGNCVSTTDAIYSLRDTSLAVLNPWLKDYPYLKSLEARGCSQSRKDTDLCHDKPSIGSGLEQLFPNYFLALADRGPTQDCALLHAKDPVKFASAKDKIGKAFPIHKFSPTIAHISHDPHSRELKTGRFVPLRGSDGQPISGLPNTEYDETPYGANCEGDALPYDPSGLDTEDIAHIPNTEYVAIADEYSPSVVLANYKTGMILRRHVPVSLEESLSKARYEIVADIPDVFKNRRRNRGFESIVVDTKGKYVIAILQSPMFGPEGKATVNNAIIRCAYFKLAVNKSGMPQLTYRKSFVVEASPPTAYMNEHTKPKDIKFSAAQYHSTGKFIALERAQGQVKLFLVDFLKATNIDKTKYANNLELEKKSNGMYTAKQIGITAAEKTLIWDSGPGIGGSLNFMGSSKMEGFAIDMKDDSKLWMIEDNSYGLGKKENVQLFKISLGRAPGGATVCKKPDHPPSPPINVKASHTLQLTNSQTYRVSDEPGVGAAKNLDVDENENRVYVVNSDEGTVDVYNTAAKPVTPLGSFTAEEPYIPTSVSVCKDLIFVAVGLMNGVEEEEPGRVDIISKDLKLLRRIRHTQCIGVADVTWSDDCKYLVVTCKGVGAEVPGGVIVADFSGPASMRFRGAKVADFKAFDEIAEIVHANGVRLIESHKPSLDFEPKNVVIDGRHAFVTLQENNAIAVVDLHEAKVTELKPMGYIERNRDGFGIDASDADEKINIRGYTFLYGMPQPDGIQKYVANDGKTYLIVANEGASKCDVEEARGVDITDEKKLNRNAVGGLKQLVDDNKMLGRLKFSKIMGYDKTTNTQEKMFHFGGRSFSIISLDGKIVFDSGEWFARIQQKLFAKIFNSNGFDEDDLTLSQKDLHDRRSDDMGMEPESVSLMQKDGNTFAFIGLERPSIIAAFDISDATAPVFVDAVHNNPKGVSADVLFEEGKQGDIDPEGLFASSTLNKLFVAGAASNTVTSYDIEMHNAA